MRHAAAWSGAAAAALAWGLFEAQWLRFDRVEVAIPGLAPELEGLRILHLTDLHLGKLSLNGRALEKALAWQEVRDLDLAVLTGDLLSRQQGEPALRSALARLAPRHGTFAVLGNHDVDESRDPFSRPTEVGDLGSVGAVLLDDDARTLEIRGVRVQVAGAGPGSRRTPPAHLADPGAALRILLAHFPDSADRLPAGAFHLVLAGHMHGGQICVPRPGGKLHLLNPFDPYLEGLYDVGGTALYVASGTGTTLVPFRFLARPAAALLVLRAAQPR